MSRSDSSSVDRRVPRLTTPDVSLTPEIPYVPAFNTDILQIDVTAEATR
jgi:hypothetical protein